MKNSAAYIFLVTLIITFFCNSCNDDCIRMEGYDCNGCPDIKLDSSQAVKYQPDIINIYLETSGSMSGFWTKNKSQSMFQVKVPLFLERLNRDHECRFFVNSKDIQFIRDDIKNGIEKIIKGNLPFIQETVLSEMLKYTTHLSNNNEVNILITDGIHDAKDPVQASAQLPRHIEELLSKKVNEFVFSVFCAFSEFNYKGKITQKSPFYFFIYGNQHNVQIISETLRNVFSELNEIHFGYQYEPISFSIIPYTGHSGNNTAIKCGSLYKGVREVDLSGQSVEFWLGLNLNQIPNYLKDSSFLTQNLKLSMSAKCNAQVTNVLDYNNFRKICKPSDEELASQFSHFARLKINEMKNTETESIRISLTYAMPLWINKINSEDFGTKYSNRTKTYGLSYLILGIESVYKSDNQLDKPFTEVKVLITTK